MESMGKKPRRRRSFNAEFKAEIVELCQRDDRSAGQVAKDFDLTETAVREWVKQAGRDTGTRSDSGLTSAERSELTELRRENRRLREDSSLMISRRVPGLMTRRVSTEMEDAMQQQAQHSEFQGWQRLVGRWATEATHPAFPGTVVSGQATFEWLEDQRFLIQRSHYDHPEIPDAIAVIGIIDGKPSMHYFAPRTPGDSGTTPPGSRSDSPARSAMTTTRSTVRESYRAMTVLPGSTTSRSPIAGLAEPPMGGDADLSAMARRVIATSHYTTLTTRDPDGRPRLSPT